MNREEMIELLNLLPEGTEIFLNKGDKICSPHLAFYNTDPHGLNMVCYITSFYEEVALGGAPKDFLSYSGLLREKHECLIEVCHHGRYIWGACIGCDEEAEEYEEE